MSGATCSSMRASSSAIRVCNSTFRVAMHSSLSCLALVLRGPVQWQPAWSEPSQANISCLSPYLRCCFALPSMRDPRSKVTFGNFSAPAKWGRTQMGSDGFNRILTGLYFFSPVGVRLVLLKTHDFKGFGSDFNRILTGL